MTVSRIIYKAAGKPDYPRTATGICRLCGDTGEGIPFEAWVKDTFTNRDLLHPGEIACDACQFVTDTKSAPLQSLTGRDKLQKMMNYSHFVVDGVWHPYHKGQKAEMLTALRANPSVAVIAVSGQKHIAFRSRVGWWQVEEGAVSPNLPRLEHCLAHINNLYRVFSKGEIEGEAYIPSRMMEYTQRYGIEALLAAQNALRPHRGSIYFELALYLAQREDEDAQPGTLPQAVSPSVADSDPDMAGDQPGLQKQVRAQHLAAVRGERDRSSVHGNREPLLQQSLFASGDTD